MLRGSGPFKFGAVEAEQVSVSIFGESMSPEEQQDRMWADGTVSVWDVETMEQQATAALHKLLPFYA